MTKLSVIAKRVITLDRSVLDKTGLIFGGLIVCTAFATLLYPAYFLGVLHYNPFTNPTDILVNLFFSVFLLSIIYSMVGTFSCIATLYFIGGVKFYLLRRNLSISDFNDLSELIEVVPLNWIIACTVFLFICTYVLLSLYRSQKTSQQNRMWFVACSCALIYVFFLPAHLYGVIKGTNIENFNRGADFLWGGQLYSMTYDFTEKKSIRQKVFNQHSNPNFTNRAHFRPISKARNIHVILLESFSSPQRLRVKNLFANGSLPYKKLPEITYAISPVYGGNSAASEFELLCGTIENYRFGGLTFNAFGIHSSKFCLPDLLKPLGYQSIASTGTLGHFFNADKAYKSMGFDSMYFYDNYPRQDVDVIRISDKELFAENRKRLINQNQKQRPPIFNYVVSIAGHGPYYLNTETRPLIIDNPNRVIKQYINRVLYTNKELTEHLSELREIDPSSIIFVIGDHLVDPAIELLNISRLGDTSIYFRKVDYLMLKDFRQIDAGTFAYHEFSQVLFKLLSNEDDSSYIDSSFLATNLGYFRRSDLTQLAVGSECINTVCRDIINDEAYHNDLSFEIIKNSISEN